MPGQRDCKGDYFIDAGRAFLWNAGQTEYIIRKIKAEAGLPEAKVVATGGLGKIVSENTDEIQIYDADLTLKAFCIFTKSSGTNAVWVDYYEKNQDWQRRVRRKFDISADGRGNRPAISHIVQGAGRRFGIHRNDKRQGDLLP